MKQAIQLMLSTLILVFTLIVLGNHTGDGLPSGSQIIIGLLFYPALVLAALLIIWSFITLFNRDERYSGIFSILLCTPFVLLSLHLWSKDKHHDKVMLWENTAYFCAKSLLKYHRLHPDRFRFAGVDEQVEVVGSSKWLQDEGTNAFPIGAPVKVKFRNDELIDLWGYPVAFGLDRNHDEYIDLQGQHSRIPVPVPAPSAPHLNLYTNAVAVSLTHNVELTSGRLYAPGSPIHIAFE
jgi:hypothetical protein